MKLILLEQEDPTGCGIACVAMLTGNSYAKVRHDLKVAMEWGPRKRTFRTYAKDLSKILAGIEHRLIRFESFDSIDDTAIVGVSPQGSKFHWVVAFTMDGALWIADPEDGELYRYREWADDYSLSVCDSIVFPRMKFASASK